MTQTPPVAAIDEQARGLGISERAAHLHGALCGWLAGGGESSSRWLQEVMADPALPALQADSPLAMLQQSTAAQFEDRDFGLDMVLADEEASLTERADALFDWCRGFVGGFGLAAGAQPPLSDEGSEALADLAKLAASNPEIEDTEEDESALAELEEFARVSALLLHGDCVLAQRHRQRLH